MAFDPSITQKVKIEVERIGDTDRHRTFELLMHVIDNLESGVKENASTLKAVKDAQLTEDDVKRLIGGAFTVDAQRRTDAVKGHYRRIFWKVIVPLAGGMGTALSAFLHSLITHWHVVPR
jgi:hypothetical protein